MKIVISATVYSKNSAAISSEPKVIHIECDENDYCKAIKIINEFSEQN